MSVCQLLRICCSRSPHLRKPGVLVYKVPVSILKHVRFKLKRSLPLPANALRRLYQSNLSISPYPGIDQHVSSISLRLLAALGTRLESMIDHVVLSEHESGGHFGAWERLDERCWRI